MGNAQSIGAYLSVQLNHDQNQVVSGGSRLSGIVYLEIIKDSVAADSLDVKFYGHENTQILVSGGEGGAYPIQDKHELICLNYVLCRFNNGEVKRGRYEFPFKILLPVGLPGKQGVKPRGNSGTGYWFVIEYFLEARLHRNGITQWDVKNSLEIFLQDPPYYSSPKIPSCITPVSESVLFCCCYKTGTMTLLANVDSTNVFVNDLFNVEYAVRNDSTSKVEKILIRVKELHLFRAKSSMLFQNYVEHFESTIIHTQRIEGRCEINVEARS
jgi:hypothetical protein